MWHYASKLLLNCLLSVLAAVVSAYVVRHYPLDGARAEAPLSVVGTVVDRIGLMFGGTAQRNVAVLTDPPGVNSSVGAAPVSGNREIEQSEPQSVVPNIAKTAGSMVAPVRHQHLLRDKGILKRKTAAATRMASVNIGLPAPCRAIPEESAMRVCPETSGRIAEFSEHEAD
jgi:hypothetical protein